MPTSSRAAVIRSGDSPLSAIVENGRFAFDKIRDGAVQRELHHLVQDGPLG